MASPRWIGSAIAFEHISTFVVADTWATSDTLTATINGKDLILTVGSAATTADVAAAMSAAINATSKTNGVIGTETRNIGGQEIAEFREITASVNSSTITITGDTKGKPVTITFVADTAGTGSIGAETVTQSPTGPNHFDNADNWSTGAVPVDGDSIWFDTGDVDCKYALSQGGVSPASINIMRGFTGTIGLPETNKDSTNFEYHEYREQYLILGNVGDAQTIEINVGEGVGSASGRVLLSTADAQTIVNVQSTGQSLDSNLGIPAFMWKGTHASNVVNVNRGDVGLGFFPDDTAVIATLNVGYIEAQESDSQVQVGEPVTLTTVNISGGVTTTRTAITTATINGGILQHEDGTMTTLNVNEGTCYYKSDETCTTANVQAGGVIDLRQNNRSRTFTNVNLFADSSWIDPFGTATVTNGWDFEQCSPGDLRVFIIQSNITLTQSAI